VFCGNPIAIPVPTIACLLAGTSVLSIAYRSCPAALAYPFVGTLASHDSFLTLTLWSLAIGPFLAWTLENLIMRFSSRASSSGIAYATGELLRHQVVHRSLLNVILLSFQSVVGLCSLDHGIPRMTSWFSVREVNLPWVFCFDYLDPVFVADFSVDEVFCCS